MTPEEAREEQEWIDKHRRYTCDSDLVPDDMRATIAAQTWEYGVEHLGRFTRWGSRASAEEELAEYMEVGLTLARLVRRPVGPVEEVE